MIDIFFHGPALTWKIGRVAEGEDWTTFLFAYHFKWLTSTFIYGEQASFEMGPPIIGLNRTGMYSIGISLFFFTVRISFERRYKIHREFNGAQG